ncbi:collagen alpha-1(XXIII) chain-like [Phycodurus eques]|uniref:collagen alpha-1(XXIII) chain-like n=1 Tax=Phycodurus eques TaxID=693459 RepID=UPI002ACE1559|nr:collagen alpha-1(XXIII) chain-like [Phycodurus eques]
METEQKWTDAGQMSQKLQKNPSKKLRWDNWRDFSSVTLCIALSLLSVGVCIGVFVRTTALQSRIVSLEQQHLAAWMLSLEQVEPVILDRLDQILEKKLAARLPKTRDVREAPYSCLCPPGMGSIMFPILWPCLKKL